MFSSLLIANRGEIAARVIATARVMGIRTIAVFSEADADARHVRLADEGLCIGPANARQSYLNIDAIVEAAVRSGAEAIHPGYGFLSENAEFARAVSAAGLIFVGPSPEAIERMSDKVAARAAAIAAGVPVLPGSDRAVADIDEARSIAHSIGFPIAVKACFGGGGRGIRVATDSDGLEAAMASAEREAGAAFGRSEIFLETFMSRPRHVEVQVIADQHGQHIHLGDRDCTVQRRHQKMIEEAPAPEIPADVRTAMQAAALALSRSVDYVGAGTVEFLFDPATVKFAFLEMNTRLQVEHGVTELVVGIDLVEAQLRVAAGEMLGLAQEDVQLRGHAIQARISAEDCTENFRPSPGRIEELRIPTSPWIRGDFGVERGDLVLPYYDSMVGKLIAWGPDRSCARARLGAALDDLHVTGVPTTAAFAAAILDEPDFVDVRHHTGSVERDWTISLPLRPQTGRPEFMENHLATPHLTERQVRLPGARSRRISVFGHIPVPVPIATPSRRALRAAENGQVGATVREGSVVSPMDGVAVRIAVQTGDRVQAGAALLVLEAMKMEVSVPAPLGGTVRGVACSLRDSVSKGQVLVDIAPE